MRKTFLQIEMEPTWAAISNIRETLGEILSSSSVSIRNSVQITATELLENAMKYRSSKTKNENIKLEFNFNHETIDIKVSNNFERDDDFQRLIATVHKIKHESNPKALYEERLKEIYDNDEDKQNRLGLFRIIHECGFDLNCLQDDSQISVIANKRIKEKLD